MGQNTRSMTTGSPIKNIFFFSLPLMAANVLQQAYIMTDALIVSRTLGVDALAALGSADWFSFMMISIIQAIAQGFAILMAQDFGGERIGHLQKTIATSIKLAIILTVVLTGLSILSISPMLHFQNTPIEIYSIASDYLYYLFFGLFAFMLFNFGSSVLRALGNSKSPMYAMVISTFLNIGLDLLFVVVFKWGVKGAALATVIAQLFAGIYCVVVMHYVDVIHIKKEDFKKEEGLDSKLLKLCYPLIFQNITIAIGGIVVQSKVNQFDIAHIAGVTALNKLFGLLELAAIAYGYAMVTYIGQNYGANQMRRILDGIKASFIIGILTSILTGILLVIFGYQIIGIFMIETSSVAKEAQWIGYDYLRLLAITLPLLYLLLITRSILHGFGDTVMPMISGIAELFARLLFALVLCTPLGWEAIKWSEPSAWIAADIILFVSLYRIIKNMKVSM